MKLKSLILLALFFYTQNIFAWPPRTPNWVKKGTKTLTTAVVSPVLALSPGGDKVVEAAEDTINTANKALKDTTRFIEVVVKDTQEIGKEMLNDPVSAHKKIIRRALTLGQEDLDYTYDRGAVWVKKNEQVLVTIAVVAVANTVIPGAGTLYAQMLIQAAVSYHQSKGDLRAALLAAATTAASQGLTSGVENTISREAIKAGVHGSSGGVRSTMKGKSFEEGFAQSAGASLVSAVALQDLPMEDSYAKTIARHVSRALVAGASSEIMGGSFEDGAAIGLIEGGIEGLVQDAENSLEIKKSLKESIDSITEEVVEILEAMEIEKQKQLLEEQVQEEHESLTSNQKNSETTSHQELKSQYVNSPSEDFKPSKFEEDYAYPELEIIPEVSTSEAHLRKTEDLQFVMDDYLDGSCFTGETLVYTLDSQKQSIVKREIQEIQVGDFVWTCDFAGEQCIAKRVEKVFVRIVERSIKLHLSNEEGIHTTPNHPFYMTTKDLEGKWVRAENLEIGDSLLTISGETLELMDVEDLHEPVRVYNLEVAASIDDNHNYCVGKDGLVVHNCNPDLAPFPDDIFRSDDARVAYTKGVEQGLEIVSDVHSVASLGAGAPLKTAIKAGGKKLAKDIIKEKSGNSKLQNRKQALNEAKDRADIPRSQQPERQWEVGNDPNRQGMGNYKYDENPGAHGRYYEYKDANGHKKVVAEHTNDLNRATKHVHAGEAKGQKQGVDPKTYDFKKEKYQNIETGKDPHIDYE